MSGGSDKSFFPRSLRTSLIPKLIFLCLLIQCCRISFPCAFLSSFLYSQDGLPLWIIKIHIIYTSHPLSLTDLSRQWLGLEGNSAIDGVSITDLWAILQMISYSLRVKYARISIELVRTSLYCLYAITRSIAEWCACALLHAHQF